MSQPDFGSHLKEHVISHIYCILVCNDVTCRVMWGFYICLSEIGLD